jgi:SAM-dependent methyltransferase
VADPVRTAGPVPVTGRCPLCRSAQAEPVGALRYDDVWAQFERVHGVVLSDPVRRRHAPAPEARLMRCTTCGLEWFSPQVPGDAAFYEEVMTAAGYEPDRWEFALAAARIAPGRAVIDFGCGEGAFLRTLEGSAGRRAGVDHNPAAVRALRAAGIEAFVDDFAGVAERVPGEFDVACAFQVLEHLADAEPLIEAMTTVVRPGGRLLIGVPNADRGGRLDLEPFDSPPHHMSRWRVAQLEELARRFGLGLIRVDREPPDFSLATAAVMRPLEARLRGRPGPAARVARSAWFRAAIGPRRYRLAVRARLFERTGLFGHGLLAELRRP